MITQKQVKRLFDYDPKTGNITRKVSINNRVKVGDIAGCKARSGYLLTRIAYKMHLNHRIVYLFHYGYMPKTIDHIDGDKLNNKIENLRGCSQRQNTYNSKISKNNKAGFKGVSWVSKRKKYIAQIISDRNSYFLGYFDDPEVANQIVRIKRLELHGEFANHG